MITLLYILKLMEFAGMDGILLRRIPLGCADSMDIGQ
jgi:hypothetical protein